MRSLVPYNTVSVAHAQVLDDAQVLVNAQVPAPLAPRWMEMPLPKDHGGQRVYWPRLAKPNKMKVGYLSQLQHGKGGEMDWNEIGRLEGKEGLLGAYHGMSFTSSYC